MKIICVVGARPNFMKIAPIIDQIRLQDIENRVEYLLVHTGQHYDEKMSDGFFRDLDLPSPDVHLGAGSGTHAQQTGKIMIEFEKVCLKEKPDMVLVVGDVNSTLACSLVASKLLIPIAHVEAGLRSGDRTMPEEINRVLTDAIADYLFTTCKDADENLKREGISDDKIYFVGNVMIDTLYKYRKKAEESNILETLGISRDYALLTLHRPSNVDDKENFEKILTVLKEVSKRLPIIFPVHPRTYQKICAFGLSGFFHELTIINHEVFSNNIYLTPPLGYLEFLKLTANSRMVFTDSGGIQEETTILRIPCLTLRENTERPITITKGTNKLVGKNPEEIINASMDILSGNIKNGKLPKLWDGKAAERIVNILLELLD